MGRELKRVPLDFEWPIGQIWKGYLNPYNSQECKPCEQTGFNPETLKIDKEWYNSEGEYDWVYIPGKDRRWNRNAHYNNITEVEVKALVRGGRLSDLMSETVHFDSKKNHWVKLDENWDWVECDEPTYPTVDEVNEWSRTSMGHDAINKYICVEARATHLGVYGHCKFCGGDGHIFQSEEIKNLSENWESFDPPKGDGFQLWSTTTEGYPMSPVFTTLDDLCDYLVDNKTSLFGRETATKQEWFNMLSDGLVFHQDGGAIFI